MSLLNKLTKVAGLALATSNNGTERDGATLNMNQVHPRTLVCECTSAITTSSVVATFKPQVSDDGTNWFDLKMPNNAANVATAAGTGSPVTTTLALDCAAASAFPYFRMAATLSGAGTNAADKTQVDYKFLRFPAW